VHFFDSLFLFCLKYRKEKIMLMPSLRGLDALSATPLLRVFYDRSCGLCRAEMSALAEMDQDHAIEFVDCSDPAFDDSEYRTDGVTRTDMLNSLHVRDILGDWHRGVDAIALLYASAGAPRLARLWAHPLTRPLARWCYPFVVRHRHALSVLGLHFVAPRVLKLFAARRPGCRHGACRSPHAA
jgi:predicted DCC family thiol-disulfide oxidoreductase YuxK